MAHADSRAYRGGVEHMSELNLCPFCGQPPEVLETETTRRIYYAVACVTSSCYLTQYTTIDNGSMQKQDAIDVWNRRADENHD